MAERSLKSDADGVRGWLDVLSRLNTIRSRLYLAFGLAAGMTVVGSLFALLRLGQYQRDHDGNRVAQHAGDRGIAPPRRGGEHAGRLRAAPDDGVGRQAPRLRSPAISPRNRRCSATGSPGCASSMPARTDEIEVARGAMVERLDALNQAVTERIKISAQRRALALSVRRAHEDILEAITPAIDDANFDLMTRNQASGGSAAVNRSIEALRRLLEIQSGTNLLSGLLIEVLDGDGCRQSGADARPHSVGAAQH